MSSVLLRVGGKATASATATPVDPTVTLPTAVFAYSSSDATIATVDPGTGAIVAIAPGSVLITATTTINGVDGSGSAGLDVQAAATFNVTVVITPNP